MKPILALRHVPHEGLGMLETLFREQGLVYSYVNLWEDDDLRFRAEQLAGLVVLGGPMNVNDTDTHPFLAHEREWIRQAITAELPILGLCLGAQLIAASLGAEVRPNGRKEIGWYEIAPTSLASDDPLFAALPEATTVFQWHGDTFDLPHDSVQLASSELCQQQAFRHGSRTWGVQFHLEVTGDMIGQWLSVPENVDEMAALPEIDPAAIERRTAGEITQLHGLASQVFTPFANLCRVRADS